MKKIFAYVLIFAVIIILPGCFTPPPPRDPLAGLQLSAANPAFKELTVGFTISETTRETSAFVDKWNTQYFGPGKLPEPEDWIKKYVSFLRDNFKSVVKISATDASFPHVDIIAILDMHYDQMSFGTGSTAQFSMKTVFLTPSRVPIAEALGQVSTSRGPFKTNTPFYSSLISQALQKMEQNVLSSPQLAEFARNRGGSLETLAAKPSQEISPVIKSDVDELPLIKVKPNKNAYAIVIGIEQYRQKLPKADFAAHDAQTMTEYLTKVMGYPEENVVTLINDRALKSDMEKYFEKWLWNNVEKDSSVFIYYSGHGAPNPKTGDAYLVPYDGDPAFIDQTGYSLKRLYDNLGKLQAKEIVVALDSCFSGAGGRSVIAKGARPLVMQMEKTAVPSNVAVLSAASGDQISSTYEEKGHGLFTYFMLKGLKGEGDANNDGKIELHELFEYIKPQVERTARKAYNNEQSPQLVAPNELAKQRLIER